MKGYDAQSPFKRRHPSGKCSHFTRYYTKLGDQKKVFEHLDYHCGQSWRPQDNCGGDICVKKQKDRFVAKGRSKSISVRSDQVCRSSDGGPRKRIQRYEV